MNGETRTDVEEEGPKRGFSLRGWKENLPRKEATHEELPVKECLGQSFMYMVTMKTTMLANTNVGTSQGNQRLKRLKLWSSTAGGFCGDGKDLRAGVSRRGWTFTSTLVEDGSLPIMLLLVDPLAKDWNFLSNALEWLRFRGLGVSERNPTWGNEASYEMGGWVFLIPMVLFLALFLFPIF